MNGPHNVTDMENRQNPISTAIAQTIQIWIITM